MNSAPESLAKKERPRFIIAAERIEKSLACLSDAVERIERKISPVLSPVGQDPSGAGVQPPSPPMSEFESFIEMAEFKIVAAAGILNSLCERATV